MFNIPPMQDLDALHPLVVHFPIALLLVAPFLILLGLLYKKKSRCFFIAGFVVMLLGTIASFVAVASGEAAGELVDKTPEIAKILEQHEDLAEMTRNFFLVITIVNALVLLLPIFFKEKLKTLWIVIIQIVFLIAYSFCCLMIANTAHLGGQLVHGLGVKAMMNFGEPANGKPAQFEAPTIDSTNQAAPPIQTDSTKTEESKESK